MYFLGLGAKNVSVSHRELYNILKNSEAVKIAEKIKKEMFKRIQPTHLACVGCTFGVFQQKISGV